MSRSRMTPLRALRENLVHKSRYLLAVSGGIDSVALAHACVSLQREFALKLEIAHVDHGLRDSSKADAEFVKSLALQWQLPFHLRSLNGAPASENIENWGRQERYTFFAELLSNDSFDAILTAHNANDVAETFLMRLLANKELKSIERFEKQRRVLRPFLLVSRTEVESYVAEQKLSFKEDPSNQDQQFLRNKVRHTLIPYLATNFDPRIAEVLSQRAAGTHSDIRFLETLSERALSGLNDEFGSKGWLKSLRLMLENAPEQLRWRMLDHLFKPKLGFNIGREHSSLLVEFIMGADEGLQLPGGLTLRRRDGGLLVERS